MAKLFEKTELLDTVKHKGLKWHCLKGDCSLNCCFLPKRSSIFLSEILSLSRFFPISFVLIKDKDEDKPPRKDINIFYKLEQDEGGCLYLDPERGCILGQEKPLSCKQYPFSIVMDEKGRHLVNLDMTCPGFDTDKGEPVFVENGLNPYFNKDFLQYAKILFDQRKQTIEFVEAMFNYNLVSPGEFNYKGFKIPINAVDESRLLDLPREVQKDFTSRGYMRYIYAHLNSIQNYAKLIDKYLSQKANKDEGDNTTFVID